MAKGNVRLEVVYEQEGEGIRNLDLKKRKEKIHNVRRSPVTGPVWPRDFQEV
jgi:hypothetical protein